MQAAASQTPPERQEEQLVRMSFGDHLEELRGRLVRALLAMGLSMLAVMPFKETVTAIYLQPYRTMWSQAFGEWVDYVDEKVAASDRALAAAPDQAARDRVELDRGLWLPKQQFLHRYRGAIDDGSFPFDDHADDIHTLGGFQLRYYLVATGGIEDFWTYMAASALFALILAAPFVLYQAWAFVGAGLYRHERRIVMRYLPLSGGLLLTGVAFGYTVVVPYGLYFLVRLMNFGQVQPLISVSQYFSLLFMLTAALGLVFQLPLVMLALHKVGIVTHETQRKHWRYVILGMFVAGALLTPPDPFTQVMMAVPMVGLYGFGLFLTSRASRRPVAPEAGGT